MRTAAGTETIREDVIPQFFVSIAGQHPEVPNTVSGSLRFDLGNDEQWRVTFDKGLVSASRSATTADCTVHTDKETMENLIQGKTNAMAALLRGVIQVEGQVLLLALFRGLLTAPVNEPKSQRVGQFTRGST